MRFVSFLDNGREQLAILQVRLLYRMQDIHPYLPSTMRQFIADWYHFLSIAKAALRHGAPGEASGKGIPYGSVPLLAPVPHPPSCRDGYAFRRHVEAARRNRGVPMIPQYDEYPVFYFTNPGSIKGPGEITCMPDHFEKLDFELEVAIVISQNGMNIRAEDAHQYIAGYMLMNDLSARRLQMEEMLLNLGPAKGKDFATATGPYLITPDELGALEVPPPKGHRGRAYDLRLSCRVNGQQVSEANLAEMDWTFGELIERASYGAELFPGDIIGSGTAGTGCFLELNGTGRLNDPAYTEQWLQPGDVVELEGEHLGTLSNTILRSDSRRSILNQKIKQ